MKLGLRHMQLLNAWTGSLATFGAAVAIGGIYFTEWRVITESIPFYNAKYKKEE